MSSAKGSGLEGLSMAAAVEVSRERETDPAPGLEPPVFMSTDSAIRKLMPVATGCYAYFPDSLLLVSWVSRLGAEKHCGGVLGWDKSKSMDEADAGARHALDYFRELPPDKGLEPLGRLGHLASKAWRALAELQRACDEERAAYEAQNEPIGYRLVTDPETFEVHRNEPETCTARHPGGVGSCNGTPHSTCPIG